MMDSACCNDHDPFDLVTVERERDDGDVNHVYRVVGQSNGTERCRRVPHDVLMHQAQAHLQIQHGRSPGDPVDPREWAHAITRAAVAFLMH
jgi:hypothetical protein